MVHTTVHSNERKQQVDVDVPRPTCWRILLKLTVEHVCLGSILLTATDDFKLHKPDLRYLFYNL
jgi:hypothetical protein